MRKTFGERLKRWRVQQRLTQVEAAERVRATQSAWSGWETGRRTPGLQQAMVVRDTTGIPLDAILSADVLKYLKEGE